ncbi:ubiquinone biosynthesis protein COQ9 [Caulobacter ginsengisoli]|uniref:Ubiquinone biosynthesis protein COQ9 n=1 Tax=Caulobacter ginsengisoli TaxID=400775 RepID=A0ABU0ISW9_9CAUL|nr:COQ9 family protein [Caulobacter ginsengisoli]MDQ0465079.1 ubiquinone biosynthesis protein COQ9 [Caulobacter ginsengisoli]
MADTTIDDDSWAQATEQRILDEALPLVPNLGWSRMTLAAAGRAAGLSEPEVDLLLPNGPQDLAALLSRRHDAAALASLPDAGGLKIRERIRIGVIARLDAAAADREAVRRWAGFLALPMNLTLAGRLIWETADGLWRWAGDTATDENHYSKRAILAGVLLSSLAVDLASGREAALANLDARIENVMAFEKWKAGLKPADFAKDVAGALARIRFGRA